MKNYNYLIIGSGIIGLTIAYQIRQKFPRASILIIDKETEEGFHASSRNSGVLHAGFYYTADSLKAKFTVEGNRQMHAFCAEHHVAVNKCGKLVVARDANEQKALHELKKRGDVNGADTQLITEEEAEEIEPNVRTYKQALLSPNTASINPKEVCQKLKTYLQSKDVDFCFSCQYTKHKLNVIETTQGNFQFDKLINCAGLYADKIARDFGFCKRYTIIPFKGIYLKYTKNKTDVKTNIYPVPDLKFPFLGVHFTKTVEGDIKIGPTAMPALWRENYEGLSHFKLDELASILWREAGLFLTNASGFRNLALEEMKKYNKNYFIKLAQGMLKEIDPKGFTEYTKPGIRAQLLDLHSKKLVQDFLIEADQKSVHILNAVSPAFTCSFPFAQHVVENYLSA